MEGKKRYQNGLLFCGAGRHWLRHKEDKDKKREKLAVAVEKNGRFWCSTHPAKRLRTRGLREFAENSGPK